MIIQKINSISYRRFFLLVKDNFLTNNHDLSASINYFFQNTSNLNNSLTEFYTLLIDLNKSENEIWENIYHRTQSEIKSVLNYSEPKHNIKNNLSNKELNEIIKQFNQFATKKNIRKAEVERLKAYNNNGILAVSKIIINSEIVWTNIYRFTNERATNIYSFGNEINTANNSSVGKAHRTLHWLDIIKFKSLGVNFYDFCGWYSGNQDKELLNINKFKEQFTKNIVKEYSGVIYKNKLLFFLKKIM